MYLLYPKRQLESINLRVNQLFRCSLPHCTKVLSKSNNCWNRIWGTYAVKIVAVPIKGPEFGTWSHLGLSPELLHDIVLILHDIVLILHDIVLILHDIVLILHDIVLHGIV